eukprot:tig00001003_g6278.t1
MRMRPAARPPVPDAADARASFWLGSGIAPPPGSRDAGSARDHLVWSWEDSDALFERRPGEGGASHCLRALVNVLILITVWPAAVLAGLVGATLLLAATPFWAPCAIGRRGSLAVVPEVLFSPWTCLFAWIRSSPALPVRPS